MINASNFTTTDSFITFESTNKLCLGHLVLLKSLTGTFRDLLHFLHCPLTQSAFTCSKLTTETLEEGVKYVQN